MSNILICYFSASGTTKKVAENIAMIVNGDLFSIDPVSSYTESDLNWQDKSSRTTIEMSDKNCRPEIKNKVEDMEKYDKIILGFPVWWYTAPRIINTFIEENNLEGKNIYVFVTSGGSSFAGSLKDLKDTYPNLNFIGGKVFNDIVLPKDIKEWMV